MNRTEQVLEENKKIDKLVEDTRELLGDKLNSDDINTLTITCINKQLIDISITLAMICDLLNKEMYDGKK